jgi:hypothetical protein
MSRLEQLQQILVPVAPVRASLGEVPRRPSGLGVLLSLFRRKPFAGKDWIQASGVASHRGIARALDARGVRTARGGPTRPASPSSTKDYRADPSAALLTDLFLIDEAFASACA